MIEPGLRKGVGVARQSNQRRLVNGAGDALWRGKMRQSLGAGRWVEKH
jgi:hypothetical protein